VVAFVIGIGVGNSASADPSPSGTSIPVKKGGTGATTPEIALQNLLPDFNSNNGKVLGSTGSAIEWVEQNNPDIQSSNDIGKVKVDDTAKTMTVSGETAISGGVVYSINRPDKWVANTELDFGGGLYGYRKTGTITTTAGNWTALSLGISGSQIPIASGGWVGDISNRKIPVGSASDSYGYVSIVGRALADEALALSVKMLASQSTSSPYDVWVTDRKSVV
jgi:hypothetical protein